MPVDLGAQYREAKAALLEHRRVWAAAEQARADWLRRHRGVPSHLLYRRDTGDPLDPELVELEAAVEKAAADDEWVRGLVIACGEAFKGCSFDEAASRRPRSVVAALTGLGF